MSVTTPTTRTAPSALAIRPGGPIIDDTWLRVTQSVHHVYARGSVRIPLYSGDDAITTASTSYTQPEPLDALTAVWRPTRVCSGATYRVTLHVYGVDADVRVTAYDTRVGGGASLGTAVASCGATAEWASVDLSLDAADVLDTGDPIPIGLTLEIQTSDTTASLYHAHISAQVLTSAQLP